MKNNKSIAILGGMGPQASSKLLEVLVSMCSKLGVKSDSDFPEIIVDSIPVPNFVSDENNIPPALSILKKRVKKLNKFDPSFFAIACNTAHLLLPKLQDETKVPFVSIIEAVVSEVGKNNVRKVGILASPTTIRSRLYQTALERKGIKVILPSQIQIKVLDKIIGNVLRGERNRKDREMLCTIALSQKNKGAQSIILGCTELPLIFPKDFTLPVFNSIEILAKTLVQKLYGKNFKNSQICYD